MKTPSDQPSAGADLFEGYSDDTEHLPRYAGLMGVYIVLVAGSLMALRDEDNRLPLRRMSLDEFLLLGLAVHKLSRLVSVDKITAPVRAPFTELEGHTGLAEVEERPRGQGMRKVIGELISCPYCVGVWISTGLCVGRVVAPRLTRFFTEVFALTTVSDFLNRAYVASKRID